MAIKQKSKSITKRKKWGEKPNNLWVFWPVDVDHSCVEWRCRTWLFHSLSGGAAWCAGWRHTGAYCRQVVKARRCRRSRSHMLQNSSSVWFHSYDTITPHHRYQPGRWWQLVNIIIYIYIYILTVFIFFFVFFPFSHAHFKQKWRKPNEKMSFEYSSFPPSFGTVAINKQSEP